MGAYYQRGGESLRDFILATARLSLRLGEQGVQLLDGERFIGLLQCGGIVVHIRVDFLQSNHQAVDDLRILRVEVVGFLKVFFQVVELRRRIAGFGSRVGSLAEKFSITAFALSDEELPFSGADREGAGAASG